MNNKRLNNESSSFSCRCISKSKRRRSNEGNNIPITKPYIPAEVYYDVESKTSKLTEPEDPSNFKNLLREVAVTTQSLYKAFSKAYHKSTKTLKDTSYSGCQTITSAVKEVVGDSGCGHAPDQSPKHLFKSGKSLTRKHKCIYMEPVTMAVPVKLHVNSDNAENIICTEIILEAFGDPIYSSRKGKKRKIEPLEDYDEPIRTATVAACQGGIKCEGGIPQDFLECLKYQGEFKGPEIDDLNKSEKYLTSGKGQKFESKQECQTIFGFLKRQPSQQNTFSERLVLNKSLVTIGSDVYFSCASSEDIMQKPKTVSNNVFDMIKDQNSCPKNLPAPTMRSIASYSDEDYPDSQQLKCGLSKGTKKFEYPSKIKRSSVLTKTDSFEMDTGVSKTMEYPSKIKRSLTVTDPEAAKKMKISQIIQTEVPTSSAATSPHRTSYATKERISQNTQTDPRESTLGRQMFPKISSQHKDAQTALTLIQMETLKELHSSDLKDQGKDFQGNLLSDVTPTKSPLPEKKIPEIYSDELKGLDKPIGERQMQRLSDPMMQKAKEEDVRRSVPKDFKVPLVAPSEIDDKFAEKVPTEELSVNIPQEDLEKNKSIPKAPPVPPKPQLHEKPIIQSYSDELKGLDEKPSRKEPIQKLSDTTFEKSEEKDKRGSLPKDFKAQLVPPLIGNETKEPLKQNDIIPTTAKETPPTESYAELLSRIPDKPKGGYLTDRVSDTVLHEPPAKEFRTSLPDDFKQPLETSNVFDLPDKKIKPPEELKGSIISDEYHSAHDINLDNTTISKSQEKDVFEKKTPDTTTKVPLAAPLSDSYTELLKQLADKPSGGFLSERVSDTVLHEPPLKEFRTTLPDDFKLSEEKSKVKEVQNQKSKTEGEPRESVTNDEYHSFHELEELKNLTDTPTYKPLSHRLSDTQVEREKTENEERRSLPIKIAEGTQTDILLDTGHQKRKSLRNDILDGLRSLADPVYAANNNNYTKNDEQIIKNDLCKILLPKKHKSEDLNDNVVEDLRYLFAYMSENKRQETPLSPSPTVGRTETLNDIRFILDPKAEIQPAHRFSKADQEKLLELLTKLLKPPSEDTKEIDTVARKSIVNQIRELLYSHNKESENEESSENEIYYTPGQHTPIKRAEEQKSINSDEFFKNVKVTSSEHNVAPKIPQIIITTADDTMYTSFISEDEQGYHLKPALENILEKSKSDQYPQHEDSEEYFDTYDDHQKKSIKKKSRISAQLSLPTIPEENNGNAEKTQPTKPLKTSQDIQTDLSMQQIQEMVQRKTVSEQTQTQASMEEIKPHIISNRIQTESPIAQIPDTIKMKPDQPTDSSKIESNVKRSFEKRPSNDDQSKENELSETNSPLLLDEKFRKFSDSMGRSDRVYEYKPEEDFVPYREELNRNESSQSSQSSVRKIRRIKRITKDDLKLQRPIEDKTQVGIENKNDTKSKSTDQPLEQHTSETSIKKESQFLPIQFRSTKRRDDKKAQEVKTVQKENIAPNTASPTQSKLQISSATVILRSSKRFKTAKKNYHNIAPNTDNLASEQQQSYEASAQILTPQTSAIAKTEERLLQKEPELLKPTNVLSPTQSKLSISSATVILRSLKKDRKTPQRRTSSISIVLSTTNNPNNESIIYKTQDTEQQTENARGSVESLKEETANISLNARKRTRNQSSNTSIIISKADGSILIDHKKNVPSESDDEIDNKKQVKTPKKEDPENRT